MKKYELVASDLSQKILAGTFQSRQKLPSVRKLCDEYEVSLSTIVSALNILEGQQLIEARERSGYFILFEEKIDIPLPRVNAFLEEPTKVSNKALALDLTKSSNSPSIYSMGIAVPDSSFLPSEQIDKVYRKVLRQNQASLNTYQTPGVAVLRQQLALYSHKIGFAADPDEIVVTSGCQEAILMTLKAITKPGDTVAIETPTYPGFWQICDLLSLEILEIPTHPSRGISLGALELAVERWDVKALLLSSNFSNPTGNLMSDEKKEDIVKFCTKKDIYIIEDDVYGDLSFDHYYRPKPLKAFDTEDKVIYCSSISKTVSPGLRVGWVINAKLFSEIEYSKYVSNLSTASTPQFVVAEYLKSGNHDKFLHNVRARYSVQMRQIIQRIHELFPEGTRVTQPLGGFILWLEFPSHVDTVSLLETAIHQGVSFTPGILFSPKSKYTNCLRLNCAKQWDSSWDEALKTLAKITKQAIDQ